jgi:hypothetical protein
MCRETGVGVSAVAYPPPLLHEASHLCRLVLRWTLSCRLIFVYVWMSGDLYVYFRPIPFLLYYYYLLGTWLLNRFSSFL